MLLEESTYIERDVKNWNWPKFQWARLTALKKNEALYKAAIAFLQTHLQREIPFLIHRMGLNPEWLSDVNMYCPACEGNGWQSNKKVFCSFCTGRGKISQGALHMTFGTEIRNLLRANGFGEKDWPVWSLDDYYSALIETVVRGEKVMEAFANPPRLEYSSLEYASSSSSTSGIYTTNSDAFKYIKLR